MVRVRVAVPDDATGIATMHVKTWQRAYPEAFPATFLARLDPQVWAQRRRTRMEAGTGITETFVAVTPDDGIAGFAEVGPFRSSDRPPVLDPEIGEVYGIYVDPDHWSTGAGRALMGAGIGWLTARGRTEIRLWVLDDNPRARRFYEGYGFVADGTSGTFIIDRDGPDATEVLAVRYTLKQRPDGSLAGAGHG